MTTSVGRSRAPVSRSRIPTSSASRPGVRIPVWKLAQASGPVSASGTPAAAPRERSSAMAAESTR